MIMPSQDIFYIFIALCAIEMVSKQLPDDKQESNRIMMHQIWMRQTLLESSFSKIIA